MRRSLVVLSVLALAACTGEPASEPAPSEDPAAAAGEAAPPAPPADAGAKTADAAAWAKFVPWNSANPEVQKTGSGVEYVVLASGPEGGAAPTADQQAEVYYEGRLNSGGPAFDSAFDRGASATFPVGAVVPGFAEALQLMKPQDRWLVFIPSELGYGPRGTPGGPIPPDADLVFEIEMVAVH